MSSPVFRLVTHVIGGRTQIGWEWLWFFSQRSFISGCFPFVLCEIFACVLIHALVLPGIPYRSVISRTAILPESPFVHVLNHSWMHLFLWKRFFFFVTSSSLFPCCTLISGTILIKFELRREKFVYSFCSAESHLTASCVRCGSMLIDTTSFQLQLIAN